jgi:hypothetical protein
VFVHTIPCLLQPPGRKPMRLRLSFAGLAGAKLQHSPGCGRQLAASESPCTRARAGSAAMSGNVEDHEPRHPTHRYTCRHSRGQPLNIPSDPAPVRQAGRLMPGASLGPASECRHYGVRHCPKGSPPRRPPSSTGSHPLAVRCRIRSPARSWVRRRRERACAAARMAAARGDARPPLAVTVAGAGQSIARVSSRSDSILGKSS